MLLEQITTDYDTQEPAPKGMVRTEMGRLVKKADQDAWDKGMVKSMNKEYFSRGKGAKAPVKKVVKVKVMKKQAKM
jgi:hypothetical protein